MAAWEGAGIGLEEECASIFMEVSGAHGAALKEPGKQWAGVQSSHKASQWMPWGPQRPNGSRAPSALSWM